MEKRIIRRTAAVIFSLFMVIAAVFGTDVGLRKVWAADNVTLTMHNATAVSVNNNVATVTVNGGTATVSLDAGTMQLSGTQNLQIAGATKATFTLSVSDGFNYSNGGSIVVGGSRIQEDGNHQYELALSENQVENIDFQFDDANNNGGNTGGNNGNQTPPANDTIQVAFGNGTVNGRTVTYNVNNTDVVITLADSVPLNNNEATVTLDNKVLTGMTVGNTFDAAMMEMKLTATDGFNCVVEANAGVLSHKANGGLPGGTLTFSIAPKSNGGSNYQPSGVDSITFQIDGASYTLSDMSNPSVTVNKADISNLEFAITSVTIGGTPYTLNGVGNGRYATAKDVQNRDVLQLIPVGNEGNTAVQWVIGMQYHGNDDEPDACDKTNTNVPSFYITQVVFKSTAQVGVKITSGAKPNMYDDTVYPSEINIAGTTAAAPAQTAVYYDSTSFTIDEANGTPVSAIQVASGFPANAVTINGNTVSFNSGYYTSIPLQVTLADGTVGFLQVQRLGIEIRKTVAVNPMVYHGNENGVDMSTIAGAKPFNVVAVFYYDAAKSYTDYDMVANITNADGSRETKVIEGFHEALCSDPSLKGGDYLIWSGDSPDAMPASVSVTAVKHSAAGGGTFGGALFGGGAGVTATKDNYR